MEQNKVQKRKLLKSSKNKIERKNKRLKKLLAIVTTINICAVGMINASADVPAGVDTASYDFMVNLVFWVAAIAIAAGGGIPSAIKIVNGHTDEDARVRNSGISGIVVTGAMIGALTAVRVALF